MANVTIQKRGKVYQYKVEIAAIDGKRKFINKSGFKTKAEATEAGNLAFAEYQTAGVPFKECKVSYSDYLDYWVENYCKNNLRHNTITSYQTIIRKYIKPKLGMYKLSSITTVRLNLFITETCNEYSFSRAYFSTILKVVKGSFRDACSLYGLIKYNPALFLRLPNIEKTIKSPKHLYNQEEIDIILDRFKNNEVFTCAFITACFTGMRTGEVFALTWDDIDLENIVVHVKHNVYSKKKDEKGRWYIGPTKTISGTRTIYFGETLLNALLNYKEKQEYFKKAYGDDYITYHFEDVKNEYGKVREKRIVKDNPDDLNIDSASLVFTKMNGKYVGTDLVRYPYKIIHEQLGIEKCRFYDLRGSYATKILYNGVEIRDVADLLGHSNVDTTENHYITSTNETRKLATDVFEKLTKSEIIDQIIKYQIQEEIFPSFQEDT